MFTTNCAYIKKELTALQLYDFYANIINTLSVWFESRESDVKTDFITELIFNSGVYGTTEAHVLSEAVKISKSAKSAKNVKCQKFIKITFLPYKNMCIKYPFLKKIPVLLPIMWIYRIFTVIFFRRDKIKNEKQAIKSMSEGNINSYQDALNFVGIDFNFKE